jgi:hypothetical protein
MIKLKPLAQKIKRQRCARRNPVEILYQSAQSFLRAHRAARRASLATSKPLPRYCPRRVRSHRAAAPRPVTRTRRTSRCHGRSSDPDGPRTPTPRTRYLANSVHRLGPGVLAYLFHDIFSGKPAVETVEEFAQLAPLAPLIESLGGALPIRPFLVRKEADQ